LRGSSARNTRETLARRCRKSVAAGRLALAAGAAAAGAPPPGAPGAVLATVTLSLAGGAPPATLSAAPRDVSAPPPPEPVDASRFAHAWSGRHDGGPLPPARAHGAGAAYGHVLDAVGEVKAAFERAMAELIAAEAAALGGAPAKRPKLAAGGGGGGGGGPDDGEGGGGGAVVGEDGVAAAGEGDT